MKRYSILMIWVIEAPSYVKEKWRHRREPINMAKSKLTCTGRLSWCGPNKVGIGICELTNKVET